MSLMPVERLRKHSRRPSFSGRDFSSWSVPQNRLKVMEPTRLIRPFEVISDYVPSGDQPQAIELLSSHLNNGETDVVLLGATGTGKSATAAWLIEKLQRPTLVMAHNKTL